MKPSKVRRRLEEALGSGRVVQVRRDSYDAESTAGIVIGLTHGWVVVHVIADGVHLDEVIMMRVRDVNAVRDGHSDYIERALRELGRPVAVFGCPPGATTRDLLVAAADRHRLTAFALGEEGEEQLMIGRLEKAGKRRVRHRFIGPDGTWAADVDSWRYQQISSIYVGGRYIDALARFGKPYPGDAEETPDLDSTGVPTHVEVARH